MSYKTGPQDGKPHTTGQLSESVNFTVVGFSTEDGDLLYRDTESGHVYTDGEGLDDFGVDNLTPQEKEYLRLAGWTE